ncbi:MAG TPA: hypothetical protein VIO38_15480 [Rariglobus sp.]
MPLRPALLRFRFAAVAMLAAASANLSAKVLAEDFSPSATDRKPEQALHGTLLPDGQTRWVTTPNLSYPPRNAAASGVNVTSLRGYAAKLPLPATPQLVRVTASLSPLSSDKQNSWTAIGIGNPGSSTLAITWDAGLLLLVHTDGRFALSYDDPQPGSGKSRHSIQSEIVPGYKAGQPVLATLQYDSAKGTVSVWINKREVLDNYDLKSKGFVPDLSYAGFSGYNQPIGLPPVSGFILETRP